LPVYPKRRSSDSSGIASSETLDAGATLYNVGDPADDVYVLESGRINFVIGREDRTTAAGFALRKGEVFGWNACWSTIRTASPQPVASKNPRF